MIFIYVFKNQKFMNKISSKKKFWELFLLVLRIFKHSALTKPKGQVLQQKHQIFVFLKTFYQIYQKYHFIITINHNLIKILFKKTVLH